MEFRIVQAADRLEVNAPMPAGRRILFLLLSLFPLLAPYELIFRLRWENYLNFFFLFAAGISAGAVAVSAFFVWTAVAGLSTSMRFDKRLGALGFTEEAPVLRRRTEEIPFGAIADLRMEEHEWSDGPPSYSFEVVLRGGRTLRLGSSWSVLRHQGDKDTAEL